MKVIQIRDMLNEKYTLSTAAIYPDNASNALFTFFVCEDTVRGEGNPATVSKWKIKGETAIPYGDYNVVWALSPSRNEWTLRLLNVPGYQGILIHGGNTPADTEGCLLPGLMRQNGSVLQSKVAVQKIEAILVPELQAGMEVVWSIRKS